MADARRARAAARRLLLSRASPCDVRAPTRYLHFLPDRPLESVPPHRRLAAVDVGANTGQEANELASRGFDVVAFEPMPFNRDVLEEAVAAADAEEVARAPAAPPSPSGADAAADGGGGGGGDDGAPPPRGRVVVRAEVSSRWRGMEGLALFTTTRHGHVPSR